MSGAQDKPFATTLIVCGVVIEQDGKYLLVQERQAKAYGKWSLPAGRVDQGETLEQTAVRETKEECGFDVELIKPLLTFHQATERPVFHTFSAKIVGGEFNFPEDEILDARWFTYEEIVGMKSELRNVEFVLGSIEAVGKSNQVQ